MKVTTTAEIPIKEMYNLGAAIQKKGIFGCTSRTFSDCLFIVPDIHLDCDLPAVFVVNKDTGRTESFNKHSWSSNETCFYVYDGKITLGN